MADGVIYRAHPTRYMGVNFRSRLEARWAAFFDLLEMSRWEYEPLDEDGWTPDFYLRACEVMVEVKPIEWGGRADWDALKAQVAQREDLAKVRASSRPSVLVLGAYPVGVRFDVCPVVGVFWTKTKPLLAYIVEGEAVQSPHKWTIVDETFGRPTAKSPYLPIKDFVGLWRGACNVTQWNG